MNGLSERGKMTGFYRLLSCMFLLVVSGGLAFAAEPPLFSGDVDANAVLSRTLGETSAKPAGVTQASEELILAGTRTGKDESEWFGRTVASIGDVNGDGSPDFVIAAPLTNFDGNDHGDEGAIYIYLTGLLEFLQPLFYLEHDKDEIEAQYGWAVTALGDFNADGYDDFAVSAPGSAFNKTYGGSVQVFFGGDPFDAVPDIVIPSENDSDRFGFSLDGGRDLNGDGEVDMVVGAKFAGDEVSRPGKAYVYFGGESVDGVADLILSGSSDGDQFGDTVSVAGDLDGDGENDLVVGASRFDDERGIVYIYHGGDLLDATPDVALVGSATRSLYGRVVDGDGDFNNDGLADLLVAAPDDIVEGSRAGKVYIYEGVTGATPELAGVLTAATRESFFGFPVKWLPDLNSDGFSDIGIGAPLDTVTYVEQGTFNIYYGGPALTTVPAIQVIGSATRVAFGADFALLGDVTGDSKMEIIVGAPLVDIIDPDSKPDDKYEDRYFEEAGMATVYSLDLSKPQPALSVFDLATKWHDTENSRKAGDYDGSGSVDERDLLMLIRLLTE